MSKAKITYCGHSAIIITTETGKKIIIDPFLEGNPKCPANLIDPGKIDYIALTHGHSDHVGSTITLAKKYNATVIAVFELITLLVKDGVSGDKIQPTNKGGTIVLEAGLKISFTNAFHSSSYDSIDGKTYYAGEPCGIVIHLESGRTIYHAGDTCLFSDLSLIQKKFSPTIALLPIGDRFTMGAEDAAEAVSLIEPKITIPIHYATFEGYLAPDAKPFVEEVRKKGLDTEVKVLRPGENFEF